MNPDESNQQEENAMRRLPAFSNAENLEQFELLWAEDADARARLIEGNIHWVRQLVERMENDSSITRAEIEGAAREGLADAVDKYTNAQFDFAPDDSLGNGYAIWYVRLHLTKLAQERGCNYSSPGNAMSAETPPGAEP